MYWDSIEKIATTYIGHLVSKPLIYNQAVFQPKNIYVSSKISAGTECPLGCSACCLRFSLDYLPFEQHPDIPLVERSVMGKKVLSYFQEFSKEKYHCDFVTDEGACDIYLTRPLSCDFELIRFKDVKSRNQTHIGVYHYGRAWSLKRIDQGRGALCRMTSESPEGLNESIRKLKRLKAWIDYFEVPTRIDEIIDSLEKHPLWLPFHIIQVEKDHRGFLRREP